jgi:hypothetical protein
MAGIAHQFGSDLVVSPTGDLATLDGPAYTTQMLLRRLLTPRNGYIWEKGYGAGLPGWIGRTFDARAIKGDILGQMFQESGVARTPAPVINVTGNADGSFGVAVQYVYTQTGIPAPPLSFTVTASGATNITIG